MRIRRDERIRKAENRQQEGKMDAMKQNAEIQAVVNVAGVTGLRSGLQGLRRLSDVMGAEITGIDLASPLSSETLEEIRSTFLKYHLLAFRNQDLTREQIQAFAAQIGEVEGHFLHDANGRALSAVHQISNLDKDGNPSENPHINTNYYWHSDKAYLQTPSLATMLYAVELPPDGGDTEFANMQMAYEALPEATKSRLDGLRGEHNFEYSLINTGRRLNEEELRAARSAVHSIVRFHPETGSKSLFVGMYSRGIQGMPEAEGQALIKELLDHATQSRFTYRHRWCHGDLVIWDNRYLIHRAVANYEMAAHRRILLRCVVQGTESF
jgi:alpha-ketoglutarate-dependent taurine dioxygenase